MTATYDLIASNVLTSSASSVTFSSIPATYRDLVLVMANAKNASATSSCRMVLNATTSPDYQVINMRGSGSSASSSTRSTAYIDVLFSNFLSTTDVNTAIIQIMDYSATDKHKSVLIRADSAGQGTEATAARFPSTSAVNSIEINAAGSNFASGSTFYLYGIVS